MTNTQPSEQHQPVLLNEVLEVLSPQKGETYLDATAGYGGHAGAVLERTGAYGQSVLVDRDETAIEALTRRFDGTGITILRTDFLSAARELQIRGAKFDLILADLGVSSVHLNYAERGFAIASDGPLDMRMDRRQELTAKTVVNTYSEAEIAMILEKYGEEPKARAIAHLIVENRPLNTTHELAEIAGRVWPKGKSRVHPATRTFQALRIAVNDELALLEQALPVWVDLLNDGGRLATISFHSLEDRMVKRFFVEQGGDRYDAPLSILTKHPLTGSAQEIVFNPRARSAKLRAAVKNKQ